MIGKTVTCLRSTKARKKQKNIYNERDKDSDELASRLILSVIHKGKISNEGKSYCFATVFNVNGTEYQVVANDKTKSLMFYIRRTEQ